MTRANSELRNAILAHLRNAHAGMCRHWFDDIDILDVNGGVLRFLVREPVQLRYLQRCCVEQFAEAAREVTGHLLAVRFVGEAEAHSASTNGHLNGAEGSNSNGAGHSITALMPDDEMLLSPDYAFEHFVIGPGNQLAHAAATAVAKKPGRAYNPLFIHGGVGLGKTHLLHAICQHVLRNNSSLRICYTSCNGFMTSFTECVQDGRMAEFRHRFRHVDMLVIDDIHDLSKRGQTQEEFFHTFNALYQAGKQIVLSSDAAPSEIPDLEERLVSRFNSGLVARIEKPCYETRVSIVRSKAGLRNLTLPEDVACYIAAKIDTNIRELEGAITKLQSLAYLHRKLITLELAKEAIGQETGADNESGFASPTIQAIIDAITAYYNIKLADLLSKRRHKSIAMPRQVAMYLARKHTRYSLEEIGGYFGGRDHTTVMHAVRTIDAKQELDNGLRTDVSRIEHHLLDRN